MLNICSATPDEVTQPSPVQCPDMTPTEYSGNDHTDMTHRNFQEKMFDSLSLKFSKPYAISLSNYCRHSIERYITARK